ncbi:unnamed protein product [Phaeothamnion confervicola]
MRSLFMLWCALAAVLCPEGLALVLRTSRLKTGASSGAQRIVAKTGATLRGAKRTSFRRRRSPMQANLGMPHQLLSLGDLPARLDFGAGLIFVAVLGSTIFLRDRMSSAVEARKDRESFETRLREIRSSNLSGTGATSDDLDLAQQRLEVLKKAEEDARAVKLLNFDTPFTVRLPDLSAPPPRGDEAAPPEEDAPMVLTFKLVILCLIVVSQLWLLLLFASDPMAPGGMALPFLHD